MTCAKCLWNIQTCHTAFVIIISQNHFSKIILPNSSFCFYYIVFSSVNINKILVAVIAFGINSGAYVSEIIRGGIKGVDPGQIEAGRSLGLRFRTILFSIVYPQAAKNSLPALTNEFISLIKETSICGYIGLTDLTRAGDIIRSTTYEAMLPPPSTLFALRAFRLASPGSKGG